jgi:hypothetical protein
MRATTRWVVSGVVGGITLCGSALGNRLSLDVVPGLWEISTSGSATGMPVIPPDVLARMRPEERLMAQALVLALVAQANEPHQLRICITPEQLRQGFDPNRLNHSGCRQTIRSGTPADIEMEVQCTGKDPLSGSMHLNASDHRTVSGDLNVEAGRGADRLQVRQSLRGHWVGASCGDVQPVN